MITIHIPYPADAVMIAIFGLIAVAFAVRFVVRLLEALPG